MSIDLTELTIKELIQDDKDFSLVVAAEDDPVEKVLGMLRDHKISSVPVAKAGSNEITGVVDILDLVTFAYTKFAKVSTLAEESYQQMEEFNKKKIGDIMNISGRSEWHHVMYNKPLSDLMSILSNPNIHRVSVINEQNDIIGFISQSRVIGFLYKYKDRLHPSLLQLMDEPVEKWLYKKAGPSAVLSINMKHFMIDALRLIWDNKVSGLAVVDDDGKLVANVSASDLKKVRIVPMGELIKDLYQPIKSFLHIRHSVQDRVMMANLPNPEPKIAHMSDTMSKVIATIVENKIHRVFVLDQGARPIAVISLCDIIARFLDRAESK